MRAKAYGRSVFLNVPFDPGYKPLFDAIVFTICDCGFDPRCAREGENSGQARIDKIFPLIAECCFGIHDISRQELDLKTGLPRFNMPFELGVFMGARHWGEAKHKRKVLLVLDSDSYRYRDSLSDIAGQDIRSHENTVKGAISAVRNWLSTNGAPNMRMPSGSVVQAHFEEFLGDLPALSILQKLHPNELTFNEFRRLAGEWITINQV